MTDFAHVTNSMLRTFLTHLGPETCTFDAIAGLLDYTRDALDADAQNPEVPQVTFDLRQEAYADACSNFGWRNRTGVQAHLGAFWSR